MGWERCSVCDDILIKEDIRIYLGKYVMCVDCIRMALNYLAGLKRIEARKKRAKERRHNAKK